MGKKKSGTSRTTISLPIELKKRMDGASEPVNWSAIAAVAFEQKLAEIAQKKERKNMSDVIERLRGSKRKSDSAEHKRGEEAGRQWAMHNAEAVQLERLADFFDELREYEEDELFEPTSTDIYSAAEVIYFAIEPDCEKDRRSAHDFWTQVVGEGRTEHAARPELLRGFVQGALDLWNQVQDQL